uniref:NIDO domain-containing protein n=1 Tax=Esox lucius TaxID=8010 RepID=A0A6Q2Z8Z4_ESOLU
MSGPLYPFGAGDTVNNQSDDGSSTKVTLQQPFVFFGNMYETSIYVPTLTYGHELWVMTKRTRSRIQVADIDNRVNGNISYQQYNTSGSILQQATQDINQYFPNKVFSANWVFIATWNKGYYYNLSGTVRLFVIALFFVFTKLM